ncbi:MAG: hypothetical protein QOD33_1726 [Pyrinomonadaceae bacterium]|nr:hypothetical protein [Pyrinomonadaceae bacterium]
MAISKGVENAGQGGKRGHSNMDHSETTAELKEASRKWRRLAAKRQIALGLKERDELDRDTMQLKPSTERVAE